MSARAEAESKLFVNLDLPTVDHPKVQNILGLLDGTDVGVKIGTEIAYHGWSAPMEIAADKGRRLFVDTKLGDLPTTVIHSVQRTFERYPQLVNIHASASEESLLRFIELRDEVQERQIRQGLGTTAVAVTVQTNKDDQECLDEYRRTRHGQVLYYAKLAADCGFEAVTCAASDIEVIRNDPYTQHLKTVVLGVRPAWSARDDQKNVATPGEAIAMGADFIGVGRPITQPPIHNSGLALDEVLTEMQGALEEAG